MTKFKKLKQTSRKEYFLFLEAVLLTGFARILILFIKLKRFSFLLGKYMDETPNTIGDENFELLKKIGLAIRRSCRIVPWRCLCYEQAIAGKIMLKKRKIKSTFYFGVAKTKDTKMIAHAWLRCGNYIVTGRKGMNRFTIVGTFA